jgi:hypothetical protein
MNIDWIRVSIHLWMVVRRTRWISLYRTIESMWLTSCLLISWIKGLIIMILVRSRGCLVGQIVYCILVIKIKWLLSIVINHMLWLIVIIILLLVSLHWGFLNMTNSWRMLFWLKWHWNITFSLMALYKRIRI